MVEQGPNVGLVQRGAEGVYLGLETFLGPMYLSLAKADRSDYGLFLSLGHAF